MKNKQLVWSDKGGDQRKTKITEHDKPISVNEKELELKLRRLTSGKGRTVIEVSGLPNNKNWCQSLAKELKKALGVGGTYKQNYIEIHGENIEKVMQLLDSRSLKWKKTGG
jgi:translation initiation factor 1